MAKTLRVRTKTGWVTKPIENTTENRLSAGEVDDNFLELEAAIEKISGIGPQDDLLMIWQGV